MTLEEAWKQRLGFLAEAKKHLDQAKDVSPQRFTAPKNCKIGVWFSSVSLYYEEKEHEHAGNVLLLMADTVWYDAVLENKGNIRVDWEAAGAAGYRCKLETGETFEPHN